MLKIKQYVKAESLEQAYELNQKKTNRIVGGMLWLKMSTAQIQTAIDLSGLGLDQIEETEDAWKIGCMVSLRDLELHEGLNELSCNMIRESVRSIVGVQFRNLATIGGSIFGRFGFSDVLTLLQKESRYSPSAEEISPLSVRSEQDFAPTGKPQRNPQTTEKEAFSEMPRKGFRIGKRAWLIREMLSVRIKRPVIRRKGKSTGSTCLYQSSSPFAAPVATVSGEKSIRRKSPIRKNTDSFFVFIVYTCRILLQ